jgi:hypothetical protein
VLDLEEENEKLREVIRSGRAGLLLPGEDWLDELSESYR